MINENKSNKNEPEIGASKPNIEGFMTDADMGLNYGRHKTNTENNAHLKEHFNASSLKLEDILVDKIKKILEHGVKMIAKGYTIEILENQLEKSPFCNDFYPCNIIKIRETGDQYKIGPRTYKYIGNGHKEISEPSILLFQQIMKRLDEVYNLPYNSIPKFTESILEKTLKEITKEECKPSENDFFLDLIGEAEKIIAAKGTIAGMGALDKEYVAPDNTNAGIVEIKRKSEFSDIIEKYKLSELGAIAKGAIIINNLLEKKYETALKLAKELPEAYRARVQQIINEMKNSNAHSNAQNQINKLEEKT